MGADGPESFLVITAAYCSSSERSRRGRKPHALLAKSSQGFFERRLEETVKLRNQKQTPHMVIKRPV